MATDARFRVDPAALDEDRVGFFRFGRVDDRFLITSDTGEWQFLSPEEFQDFYRGRIQRTHPLYAQLQAKGFFKDDVDLDLMAARTRRKKAFLEHGPHLHLVVTTLRCNQACRYCHASRTEMDRVDTDMSLETARQVVDFAFKTTSPVVNFEFQGGEPTVNFEAIRFICDYALEKNRYEGKELIFSLVTNMTTMDEEKLEFLYSRGVMICTSLDGPEDLHNYNRLWTRGGNAYAEVVRWMDRINRGYVDRGLDPGLYHVDALMTTTRASLGRGREIVDEYVRRGLKSIHLRPLNPYGFATSAWKTIGYSRQEFLEFWRDALDYIIELNLKGVEIQERAAAFFLTKMLTPDDPNYTDTRSPSGNGLAQLAYNYDGSIYTSDEGRMVGHMNNHMFRIGHVASSTYAEVVGHPTVKALAVASITDALPGCSTCVYKPYCGVDPLNSYMMEGDLFGQRYRTPLCQERMGQQEYLFRRLMDDRDGSIERIFRRWTIRRSPECTLPDALADGAGSHGRPVP